MYCICHLNDIECLCPLMISISNMKNDLVVKDNALINASYYLSLTEQRLILLAIIQARAEKMTSSNEFKVQVSSYINAFGVERSTAYEKKQKAVHAATIS